MAENGDLSVPYRVVAGTLLNPLRTDTGGSHGHVCDGLRV